VRLVEQHTLVQGRSDCLESPNSALPARLGSRSTLLGPSPLSISC